MKWVWWSEENEDLPPVNFIVYFLLKYGFIKALYYIKIFIGVIAFTMDGNIYIVKCCP